MLICPAQSQKFPVRQALTTHWSPPTVRHSVSMQTPATQSQQMGLPRRLHALKAIINHHSARFPASQLHRGTLLIQRGLHRKRLVHPDFGAIRQVSLSVWKLVQDITQIRMPRHPKSPANQGHIILNQPATALLPALKQIQDIFLRYWAHLLRPRVLLVNINHLRDKFPVWTPIPVSIRI